MTSMENTGDATRKGYTPLELDCATDFAAFLYQLWIKSRKNEIMEMDKTFYDNEGPNDVN